MRLDRANTFCHHKQHKLQFIYTCL